MTKSVVLFFAGSLLAAQAADVSGKLERTSGFPATYVRVTLTSGRGASSSAYSGSDGTYFFRGIAPGTCRIEIWNGKERAASYKIEVREPTTKVPDIKLP